MKTRVLIQMAVALMLAACSGSKALKPEAAGSGAAGAAATDAAAPTSAVATGTGGDSSGGAAQDTATGVQAIIYFDFDSSEIRAEYNAMLAQQARKLGGNVRQKLRLEGNTDERGSREYNIGLGERRAQAVRRAMLLQGAGETQLSTVSFGEEKPAQAGSSESARTANRRVELVYAN